MKLNLKNLTACMAISLGTICSVNAMQENIIVQNSRIDSTVAALMSDHLAYNDENDPMIMANAQRLVAECYGQNADKILKFKIDEHLARRRCAQILKRIHRACNRFDTMNITEVNSADMNDVLAIILDDGYDSFPYIIGKYMLAAYLLNGRTHVPDMYSHFDIKHTNGNTQTIINEFANAYTLMVALENGLEEDQNVVNASHRSMLMKLTERAAHGFVRLAYELEQNGNINMRLLLEVKDYIVGAFCIPDEIRDTTNIKNIMGIKSESINDRLENSRLDLDLSYNSEYSVALRNLCRRNGETLQGVINAVNEACMAAKWDVLRG